MGTWLPEPILTSEDGGFSLAGPEQQEALSLAFLRLLEALSPPERAVFLLHEIFDYPFSEIGVMLSKSPGSCRQIFHRARQVLQDRRMRFQPEPQRQHQLLFSFLSASQAGDMATLTSLLAGWWRQGADKPQTCLRPAGRSAFLVERDAQKSDTIDLYAGRDQWQPGHLVPGRGQPGWSPQPVPERRWAFRRSMLC